MRSALAYRPAAAAGRDLPLQRAGALPALAYVGSLVLVAFLFSSPLVLAAAGIAVALAGLASGARAALGLALRYGIALAVVVVAVNAIVTQRGDTVLVRGFDLPILGSLDVTLESLAAGGVIALRIVVVFAAFAVYSACVDPDAVLRLVRPLARRSALTATLIARLVPLAAADHARLREAAALRGPAAAPAGRAAIARRLLAGALDRSLDVAATLELRGYALAGAASRPARRPRSRHGAAFLASGIAIAVGAVGARAAGLGGFETYPSLGLDAGAAELALAAAIPLVAALPLAAARPRRKATAGAVAARRGEVASA